MRQYFRVALILILVFFISTGVALAELNLDMDLSGSYEPKAYLEEVDWNASSDTENYFEHELKLDFELNLTTDIKFVASGEYDEKYGEKDTPGEKGESGPFELKKIYLDAGFLDNQFRVKVGEFGVAMPAAFQDDTNVLDDEMGAFEFTTKLAEQFSLVLGMARPLDNGDHIADSIEDLYYLHLPIETNNFSITPHALFSRAGKDITDSGDDSTGMWLGIAFEMDMDPMLIQSDLYYGKRSDFIAKDTDESGYFFDASLSYKMDVFTPQLFGIYSSGEDDDGDENERLPSYDDEVEPYNIYGDAAGSTASGIATVGLALNDFSFINKLEHTIIGGYIVGTNDKNSGVDIHESELTEDDSLVEIDFNSKYEILKDKMHLDSLDLILNLGYAIPDFEKIDPDNAYYLEFGFEAEF